MPKSKQHFKLLPALEFAGRLAGFDSGLSFLLAADGPAEGDERVSVLFCGGLTRRTREWKSVGP